MAELVGQPLPSGRIELGRRVVHGGFFATRRDPPARTPFIPQRAASEDPYRHCVTYIGGGSSIQDELVEMLDSAREKVFVATLYLGDAEIRRALLRAAERLRGGVYVVASLDDKGLDMANETDDTTAVDKQTEYRNFKEITTRGIYVRGFPGLHAKYVVVDDSVALVSSANLGTRAFRETGENGVVVTSRPDVLRLATLFARLWELSPYDLPPNRGEHGVTDRTPGTPPTVPDVAGNGPVWTWAPRTSLLDAAHDIINSASADLVLATFSIAGLTHPISRDHPAQPGLLFEPVRKAVDRGVDVRLLLRGRNNSDASRNEAAAFADAGVSIFADRHHHAKGVIADRARGALFSANFVAHKGLTGGIEVGMRLDGSPAINDAYAYFEHVMAESDMELVRDPLLGDLASTLYADSFTRWPHPEVIEVSATPEDWDTLAAQSGVVLYESAGSDLIILRSGGDRWELAGNGAERSLTRARDSSSDAAATLEGWLRRRPAAGVQRGLCPAALTRVMPSGR